MLDCHCHLDRYPQPEAIAAKAAKHGVFTVAVTNLPSHFRAGLPHVRRLERVRLAVGLHPLASSSHVHELELFEEMLQYTSFVGEVGLDFSPEGRATRDVQVRSFRRVTQALARGGPKVVSLHSRGAERAVLDALSEAGIRGAIFHWYSGPLGVLEEAISAGHYFSINPAMTRSERGRGVIARIPQHRVLTESDGPYVRLGSQPAAPWDVMAVEDYLAVLWGTTRDNARASVWSNFQSLLFPLRGAT